MRTVRAKSRCRLLCAAALVFAGCSGKEPAVGTLQVDPGTVRLPYPGFTDLDLTWSPAVEIGPADDRPTVFVHLLADDGEVLRTFDHLLPAPWRAGSEIAYPLRLHQSALADPLPAGSYRLTVGLYRPGDGKRWRLATAGAEVGRREYLGALVEVPSFRPGAPRFELAGDWMPTESGTDRQVLARRWLAGSGRIRLVGAAGPGTVWLCLKIPPQSTPGARLVGEKGGLPTVRVACPAGGTEAQVQGGGSHAFEIPLPAGIDPESLEIELEPNFYLLREGSFERRALALEALAWRPAETG